jgi:hypothetical protein
MVRGVPRAWMFQRIHNYDLKKKMYSRLALSRTDNYDLKKKVQSSGRFIITSEKKGSVIWPSVGMFGGGSMSLDVSAGS